MDSVELAEGHQDRGCPLGHVTNIIKVQACRCIMNKVSETLHSSLITRTARQYLYLITLVSTYRYSPYRHRAIRPAVGSFQTLSEISPTSLKPTLTCHQAVAPACASRPPIWSSAGMRNRSHLPKSGDAGWSASVTGAKRKHIFSRMHP